MIGKKRTYDVQFYTEAGLQAEDLDMRRRGNDDDEIEAEEREKAQRKKLNEEFEAFTRAVESAARDQIEFDIPYRDLGFQGAPSKACVNLYPTVHCLVNLTDAPFFIMTLEEIEIAHFERIQVIINFNL
jgi:nucleosome binding factor SPN SPT16 subunit